MSSEALLLLVRGLESSVSSMLVLQSKCTGRVNQTPSSLDISLACRLGIPDTEYSATVKMPSSEFQRIVK